MKKAIEVLYEVKDVGATFKDLFDLITEEYSQTKHNDDEYLQLKLNEYTMKDGTIQLAFEITVYAMTNAECKAKEKEVVKFLKLHIKDLKFRTEIQKDLH